jgi:phosphatidylserine decarboxylase
MDNFSWPEPPNKTAFPVARAGYPIIFIAAFATLVFALLELTIIALFGLMATLFVYYFFRDPDRVIVQQKGAVVSPADGRIIFISKTEDERFYKGPCLKISIFMSVFNVHVNRIPHEGEVKNISYYPGKFFSANLDKASKQNEYNAVLLQTEEGIRISFVQIAGLIARRIICKLQVGDKVLRGQRFGMICFGSRVDVYLPENFEARVVAGENVKAGATVLGFLS